MTPIFGSPAPVNVARHLPERARQTPHRVALRVPSGTEPSGAIRYEDFTFEQLDREVDYRCMRLAASGIRQGTKVLMMVRPGLELTALFFSIFKIGAIPVLIDPGMGLKSFLRCVAQTKPRAMVSIPAGIWVARFFRRPFRSVAIRLKAGMPDARAPAGIEFPVAATKSDDPAAILFTSGSTGPAKGVCYEHGMFAAQVGLIRERYEIEPGEVDLPMLPVFALFNPAFGMTTVIPEMNPSRPAKVDPERIVSAIRQSGVTNSFGAPVLWRKIGGYCRERNIRLPTIKRILMAGTPVAPSVLADFRAIIPSGQIHTPYGATECLPVCTIGGAEILAETCAQTEAGRGTCVGRTFPGVEVRVIAIEEGPVSDESQMTLLPTGEVGEIVVRGPVVTREYDNLPDETRNAKIAGREGLWHRIGDIGYFDSAGRLWFCGRKADRVVTAEGPLYTDCCEAVFNRHPHVARSALIGFGKPGLQEPAIVVEPEAGHYPHGKSRRQRFIEELRELGSGFEMTRKIGQFYFARTFPVDVRHNAKIHRQTLAAQFDRKWRRGIRQGVALSGT